MVGVHVKTPVGREPVPGLNVAPEIPAFQVKTTFCEAFTSKEGMLKVISKGKLNDDRDDIE